ncbi:MAG: competence protein CoiA family protein [Cetobacterium sp.]|uniref:competence protein CoiA family protein n=1 Tax=Cetobacterium sp. TaxID=2071632 RepID=UPI003F33752E
MLALNSKNEIVHIKNALTKLDYYCADCGGILRVRNGKIKVKHYYHLSKDCGNKGESLIHRYWKEYFSKLKEFKEYKIIDSRMEVQLLQGNYIPDVVLKTEKETYLIIEICYKNPKTVEYLEKYKKLSKLEKVYEIKVDFNEII